MPPEIIALTRHVRALWHRFDWLPEWAVIGLVLLVQLFVGLVMVLTTEHDIPAWEFGAYLFGMVALLPVAFLWSVAERESRWGMAVLFFAGLALLVMTQRVVAIWYEIPALLSH